MKDYALSICIPSRREEFLNHTIRDILKNKRGDTQVIVGLDGEWPVEPIENHPDVVVLFYPESIGQRAITNQCVGLSRAKYVMKVDAHCAFDEAFDVKLMADMRDDWTVVPIMRNLHVFDWVCEEGHRRYQGPSGPCQQCGKPTTKDIKWIAKTNPQSTSYCFDSTPHFQYFREFCKRPEGRGNLTETMSLQGSCFMMTRDKYWELDVCNEDFGSWGSQGIEVAVKTWLSGGRVMVNHKTFYAHCFRTQGGDFGFPYELSGRQVEYAKTYARDLFFNNKWPKQTKSLRWLVEKFWPVPGWSEDDLTSLPEALSSQPGVDPGRPVASVPTGNMPDSLPAASQVPSCGILYYSDNRLDGPILKACQQPLIDSGLPVTSVSLKPLSFGRNLVVDAERSYATLFRQILTGLENMTEDIVYLAEQDVLYSPDHFAFVPSRDDVFYYNGNYWCLRTSDGFAVHYDMNSLSGLVGYRQALLAHFRERVKRIEAEGFSFRMGFEPFTHRRIQWETWYDAETFMPERPNIDLAHGKNATWKRWSPDQFRRKPRFWQEADAARIPGWPDLPEIIRPFSHFVPEKEMA